MWRRRGIAAFALLAILAGNATTFASIPDSNGVITSCYSTDPASPFGRLRVIDLAQSMSCTGGENQLTFNQQGPQGLQGPVGPVGPAGPAGPSGPGVQYIRYPWHPADTVSEVHNAAVKHAETSMVLPSGTWVVKADVVQLAGANVHSCLLGLTDGFTVPPTNYADSVWPTHERVYPYFEPDVIPELTVHGTLTQPSYAVLRCEPDYGAGAVLLGDQLSATLEAWKVDQADDSNGHNVIPPGPPTSVVTTLAHALAPSTSSKLLQISGGVKLTRKLRARIVLLTSQGESSGQVSALTGATAKQVATTLTAFNKHGLSSLH